MTDFIDWNEVTPENVRSKLPALIENAEKAVAAIERSEAATYESLVWALDDATHDLWSLWGETSHMLSVMNSEEWRKVEEDFQPQIIAFSLRVGQSKPIYAAAKRLAAAEADPTRKRILEKMCIGAEHSGVALEGEKKERFNAIQREAAKLGTDFSNAVLDATKAYKFEKGGKVYTIDDANYPQTMKECTDREVRENLCRARSTRAPENTARIARLLELRAEVAGILGYANFAELSISSKCAPSVKAVFDMIDELDAATVKIAGDEAAELAAIAKDPACGIAGEVMPWDQAYLSERLRERKYSYSEEELKKYFEFEDVLAGLFRMAKFLFGVEVEEVKGAEKPPVWHRDVRFFRVKEDGGTIAHFYLDPYVRNGLKNGGAWMNEFRNRSLRKYADGTVKKVLPLALVVLNNKLPDENGKTYMPFREVETVFHEFGHACQQMLTRIDEENAAGINLVEWDAVEVASQFMENWCLDDRTGITVPAELKAKVRAAKNFRAATACRRQLSFAKTDMLIHSEKTVDANAVKTEVFRHFGMPMVEGELFLNAFTHIFSGGYSAGYYGYKWSEVMSADCYGAFEDAGLDDDAAVRATGRRYRETVLALGGSASAYDVFVRFRGRKPTSEALLRQQGLR